jgi:hypothetical protein
LQGTPPSGKEGTFSVEVYEGKYLLLREGGVPEPLGEGEVVGRYWAITGLYSLKYRDNEI